MKCFDCKHSPQVLVDLPHSPSRNSRTRHIAGNSEKFLYKNKEQKKLEPLYWNLTHDVFLASHYIWTYWHSVKGTLHKGILSRFLQKHFFLADPRYISIYFPFLLLYLFGAQSSSHISVPRQVSLVASTASPKGTVSWGKKKQQQNQEHPYFNGMGESISYNSKNYLQA